MTELSSPGRADRGRGPAVALAGGDVHQVRAALAAGGRRRGRVARRGPRLRHRHPRGRGAGRRGRRRRRHHQAAGRDVAAPGLRQRLVQRQAARAGRDGWCTSSWPGTRTTRASWSPSSRSWPSGPARSPSPARSTGWSGPPTGRPSWSTSRPAAPGPADADLDRNPQLGVYQLAVLLGAFEQLGLTEPGGAELVQVGKAGLAASRPGAAPARPGRRRRARLGSRAGRDGRGGHGRAGLHGPGQPRLPGLPGRRLLPGARARRAR